MSQTKEIKRVALQRVLEAIDSLSDDEIQRIADASHRVEIRAVKVRAKDDSAHGISPEDIKIAIEKITALSSREEAHGFLVQHYPTKKILESIARRLDIPIIRQDKVDDLRDKIVEATVGSRIRSQAIQGSAT